MESKIVYFENPGKENTEEVLRIAKQRAEELGIKTVLVASTAGYTALKAIDILEGLRLIAISHSTGFKTPGVQEFTAENQKAFTDKGGILLTATHAFAGLSRAVRRKFDTVAIGDIVANTLRLFGHGMKVVCEITVMAADSGLVSTDEDVIAIAGTGAEEAGRGADTAVVLCPVNSDNFFDLKVKEILCKPHF